MGVKDARYEYADDPEYFKQMVEQLGVNAVGEMMGYASNSVRQMADGRRKVRQFVEFAAQQYIENQEKTESRDSIFIFTCSKSSKEYLTIKAVADAMGVKIETL
jgi:hypothetical protein